MITVVYPPGASDPIHRHNAHTFVYVLEGSVVMQLNDGKEITLTPGQTFYEGPKDGLAGGVSAVTANNYEDLTTHAGAGISDCQHPNRAGR